jgi:hypothetical protein
MGVTAKSVVVVARFGAGFVLGYAVAPHPSEATGATVSSQVAAHARGGGASSGQP